MAEAAVVASGWPVTASVYPSGSRSGPVEAMTTLRAPLVGEQETRKTIRVVGSLLMITDRGLEGERFGKTGRKPELSTVIHVST